MTQSSCLKRENKSLFVRGDVDCGHQCEIAHCQATKKPCLRNDCKQGFSYIRLFEPGLNGL